MAPTTTVTAVTTATVASPIVSRLDSNQVLRASTALLRKINADEVTKKTAANKTDLLADADEEDAEDEVPVWLILTTKKHILDKKRLKPGKILLPHPYLDLANTTSLRICLISADPQRTYKDLIAHPAFPLELSRHIRRVIGLTKLKAKYKSYESRRKLLSEYDLFLADDRIVTELPRVLGKVFFSRTSKRPIPVALEGKRQITETGEGDNNSSNKRRKLSEGGTKLIRDASSPAACAAEISRTLRCALVHLAPSATTAVKVGVASQSPEEVQANIEAVVPALIERFVPRKWKNVRAVHVKGPNTAALPIWMTDQLWVDENDIRENLPQREPKDKKRKRGLLDGEGAEEGEEQVIEIPGPDGKMRRLVKPPSETASGKKRKSVDGDTSAAPAVTAKKSKSTPKVDPAVEAAEKLERAARKEDLKRQKAEARAAKDGEKTKKVTDKAVVDGETKAARKARVKAEDLF